MAYIWQAIFHKYIFLNFFVLFCFLIKSSFFGWMNKTFSICSGNGWSAKKVQIHYLKQRWTSSLMLLCIIRTWWDKPFNVEPRISQTQYHTCQGYPRYFWEAPRNIQGNLTALQYVNIMPHDVKVPCTVNLVLSRLETLTLNYHFYQNVVQ